MTKQISGNNKTILLKTLNTELVVAGEKINRITFQKNLFSKIPILPVKIISKLVKDERNAWDDYLCIEQLIIDLETDTIY